MKCPKCGYNSFEIHDTCKKCANDLSSYKDFHKLKSIVFPLETRTIIAEKLEADKIPDHKAASVEESIDMFSFDIPEVETTVDTGSFLNNDPFDFGSKTKSSSVVESNFSYNKDEMPATSKTKENVFDDILESISQKNGRMPSSEKSIEVNTPYELDLSDFTWDDLPTTASGETSKPAENDFNSLFGDTKNSTRK